jgi:ABC-type antimicrobial peptide transport system permease subunit
VERPVGLLEQERGLVLSFSLAVTVLSLFAVFTACICVTALTLVQAKEMEREIAIRRACGASQSVVLRRILREVLWLVLAAAGLGIAAAQIGYLFAILVRGLPAVNALGSLLGGLLAALAFSTLAAYFPARSAARQPPASLF